MKLIFILFCILLTSNSYAQIKCDQTPDSIKGYKVPDFLSFAQEFSCHGNIYKIGDGDSISCDPNIKYEVIDAKVYYYKIDLGDDKQGWISGDKLVKLFPEKEEIKILDKNGIIVHKYTNSEEDVGTAKYDSNYKITNVVFSEIKIKTKNKKEVWIDYLTKLGWGRDAAVLKYEGIDCYISAGASFEGSPDIFY